MKDSFKKVNIQLTSRTIFMFTFILQHFFKKSSILENQKKKSLKSITKKVNDDNSPKDVERVTNLTEKVFKSYVKAGIPVIFEKEALDWEATKKWNLDFLYENYKDESFPIVSREGLDENFSSTSKSNDGKLVTIKELIEKWKSKDSFYLRFCRIMERFPELQDDCDQNWLRRMRQCFMGHSYQSFIGPKDRVTPWHCGITAFFFIMVDGEKEWEMYPAKLSPLMNISHDGKGYFYSKSDPRATGNHLENISPYTCKLEKGDILFIPAWMWHKVKNKSDTWGVSYRFVNIRGALNQPAMSFIRFFFTKPSFLRVLYNSFKNKQDDDLSLTPKLYLRNKK